MLLVALILGDSGGEKVPVVGGSASLVCRHLVAARHPEGRLSLSLLQASDGGAPLVHHSRAEEGQLCAPQEQGSDQSVFRVSGETRAQAKASLGLRVLG